MDDANARKRRRLSDARLYVCTDIRRDRDDLAAFVEAILSNGVDVIQLRHKGLEARDEIAALEIMSAACQRHGALLAVNDRADIAFAVGADIVHLGQGDLPIQLAREIVGDRSLIGCSNTTVAQVEASVADADVDYVCIGPIWATPTKPGRPAAGLKAVADTASAMSGAHSRSPWFAIGGIDETNLDAVLEAGATRVVVARAICEAEDPAAAAARIATRLGARSRGVNFSG